jgi:NodT family efflux transporter outer membrane factor (OMF) lipoprotein
MIAAGGDHVNLPARTAILATLSVLCGACATTRQEFPAPTVPGVFTHAGTRDVPMHDDSDWYRGFGCTELDRLLASASSDNLAIAVAAARVRAAAARARAARASLFPQLDAGAAATRYAGRTDGASASETDWSALLAASYEIDFWGRNRAAAQSAVAAAQASSADRDTMLLTTRASVASGYFFLLSLRERLSIAREDLAAARDVLAIIEARYRAGTASAAELAAQQVAVANAEVIIPDLQGQETGVLATLAVLAGRDPEGFAIDEAGLEAIREPALAAGLPADLLRRRPDIIAAESTLIAAHADLEVARAAFFPAVTLTAAGGVQHPAMQAAITTLAGTGPTLTVGAGLLQTIFDGGRRRAVREEAAAREEEMLAVYRSAIRNALLDVERALGVRHALEEQRSARLRAVEESRRAFDAARARYVAGAADHLLLLDAQRTLHAVRDADAQYRLARLESLVSLYRSLGGGWQETNP